MPKIEFTEENISKLFGHEAAEDEDPKRLREYYFKKDVFSQVTSKLPLRILVGHKGVGKSALFKVAMLEDEEQNILTLLIQPNDIAQLNIDNDDFLKKIRQWQEGLTAIITKKIFENFGIRDSNIIEKAKNFSGNILEFVIDTLNGFQGINLNPSKEKIKELFLKSKRIHIYIDDLDRGWQGRSEDVNRISALLNAVRDISNENRTISFKISLRADVYFLVRTSDESTDKIEGSVIWHSWTNHEIFVMLIKRIETFFGHDTNDERLLSLKQNQLTRYLNSIMDTHFQGKGKWQSASVHRVLLSMIRKRPRDLVKLCTLAAKEAAKDKNAIKISTPHIRAIFEKYSQGRVQDTINEYRSELPEIKRLLMNMKPTRKEKKNKSGYIYTTNDLLKKISTILERGELKFKNGKKATPRELATFMYKINFLTATKIVGDKIIRKYFEESNYLFPQLGTDADFGFNWEVHPAYRWALQPDDTESIYYDLDLTTTDANWNLSAV